MRRRLIILACLLLIVVPSSLFARWINDKETFQVEATGPVVFSHYNHLEALGKNCPTCHNSIFNIVTKKNKHATMADMENGKSCGACHNGNRAFSVKDDCSMCHPTRTVTVYNDSAPAQFPHDVHTSMYGCSECHTGLFKPKSGSNPHVTMKQMADGEACGACHDGSTAFSVKENCSACHVTKDIKFETDAGEATFPHETHIGMYGCDECHPGLFIPDHKKNPHATMEQMSQGESCGACHDGNTAFSVEDNCDTCHAM